MFTLALLLAAAAPPQEGGAWRPMPWHGPYRAGPRRDGPGPAPAAPRDDPSPLVPPQRRGDQYRAFEQRREGGLPLREIENRVIPTMRGAEYIGFDYDPRGGIYTLKFLRNGTVVWIEVDGRSGQVLGRTRG